MIRPWKMLAERIYHLKIAGKVRYKNTEIKEMLGKLYPETDAASQFEKYQLHKLAVILMIAGIGVTSAIVVSLCSRMDSRLAEGRFLRRNEWGEGTYYITLRADTETEKEAVSIAVEERKLTESECKSLLKQAVSELKETMLGENPSLDAVRTDLKLVKELKGYPFSITWSSSDWNRIGGDGKINTEQVPQEGAAVFLTAVISYEDRQWEEVFGIKVMPAILTQKQAFSLQLQQLLERSDKLYQEESTVILPDEIGDQPLFWKEIKEDQSVFILLLSLAAAVLIPVSMDKELKKKEKKREQEMQTDYPEFVTTLQLYMGAGLTVKNTFLKLGRDYKKEKDRIGKRSLLYEEILLACYLFSNGTPEEKVYQEWGKRCGEMNYRKLSFLLSAHIRQGNDRILQMLTEESVRALEERKNRARKNGEEAGTKMLLPLMLMLVEVMLLILLPAFTGFGQI